MSPTDQEYTGILVDDFYWPEMARHVLDTISAIDDDTLAIIIACAALVAECDLTPN